MLEWLLAIAGGVISGAVGGVALYDRWLRHKNQITGEIAFDILPGEVMLPGENPGDPPIIDSSTTDGIIVQATVHNNTAGPVVVKDWEVKGPPIETPPYSTEEVIGPGQTMVVSGSFVPDWKAWDQRLDSGLTRRSAPEVRVSLIALSRASSRQLTLRSDKYKVSDETVKENAAKPAVNSGI